MRQTLPLLSALLIGTGLLAAEAPPPPAQSRPVNASRPQAVTPTATAPAVGGRPWYALPKLPSLPWSNSQSAAGPSGKNKGVGALGSNSNAQSQAAFARLSERRGQTDHAEAVYRELLKNDPTLVQPHHRLGVIEAKKGNFDAANTHFQLALMRAPKNVDLLVDAGYCLYLQSRLEEAEEVYSTAFRINPDHESLCNNLGLLFGEQRRFEEALTVFKRCNTVAEAHANLGFVMAQLGEVELAERNFHAALRQDPKLRSAAIALVQLEKAKQIQAIATRATTPPTAAPVVPAPVTELPAPPPAPQDVALLPSQPASEPPVGNQLPSPPTADDVAQFSSLPPSLPNRPFPAQAVVDDAAPLPSHPVTSAGMPFPEHVVVDDALQLPTATPSQTQHAWNPEFVTAAAFQPQSSLPSSARAVVEDGAGLPGAETAGSWQGQPGFDMVKRADVVVGGQKTVGDTNDDYPIRYAGRFDAGAVSPPAPDTFPRTSSNGQLPTQPGSGSVVVEDVESSAARSVPKPPAASRPSGIPTELPPAHRIAPPMAELPSATVLQPVLPVSGSHYNLSPHAQPWSSPNATPASREIGDQPYPTTNPGGVLPSQQLPTAPNSRTTFRR
ncbi:MAG: tetratricopeptide repeat protein [Pirellulaceae bacterium]|nr:tetratricopeptide repeat protein [Pirellulaceae bacterium]